MNENNNIAEKENSDGKIAELFTVRATLILNFGDKGKLIPGIINESDSDLSMLVDVIDHYQKELDKKGYLTLSEIKESIEQTKWKIKGLTKTKTKNLEDDLEKTVLLKIGELQLKTCDAVMEQIRSDFAV